MCPILTATYRTYCNDLFQMFNKVFVGKGEYVSRLRLFLGQDYDFLMMNNTSFKY